MTSRTIFRQNRNPGADALQGDLWVQAPDPPLLCRIFGHRWVPMEKDGEQIPVCLRCVDGLAWTRAEGRDAG